MNRGNAGSDSAFTYHLDILFTLGGVFALTFIFLNIALKYLSQSLGSLVLACVLCPRIASCPCLVRGPVTGFSAACPGKAHF